ncbi:MAG TPA: elongation factor G, partial [Rhodospirillaceae bacterium]|nr:elongation factor G [Rhodospirillaceae bacterium]
FINKMDRMGADFYRCVDMIVDRLGATPCIINLPVGSESEYDGLIDLVRMKHVVWKGEDLGAAFEYVDIPADMKDKAEEYRHKLVELVVEFDDAAMEAYL